MALPSSTPSTQRCRRGDALKANMYIMRLHKLTAPSTGILHHHAAPASLSSGRCVMAMSAYGSCCSSSTKSLVFSTSSSKNQRAASRRALPAVNCCSRMLSGADAEPCRQAD